MKSALALVACAALVAAACDKPKSEEATRTASTASAAAPSASSGDASASAPDPEAEALFVAFNEGLTKQLQVDAKAIAAKKFKTRDEAVAAMQSLSPAGTRLRPEFASPAVKTAMADPATFGARMASFARSHPDVANREADRMMNTLGPDIQVVFDNVAKQFPADAGTAKDAGAAKDAAR